MQDGVSLGKDDSLLHLSTYCVPGQGSEPQGNSSTYCVPGWGSEP